MNTEAFLSELRSDPEYKDQIVYVHSQPAREAMYAAPCKIPDAYQKILEKIGIHRLYSHQGEAIRLAEKGKDFIVATGTASGKTFCYILPVIRILEQDPQAAALLLFPTKALSQDQFKNFRALLQSLNKEHWLAGVCDGDTPAPLRRKLRDSGSVIFSNPDMLHAGIMAQHSRWADFISRLRIIVLDELHTYSGIFGSNMAMVMKRFLRICEKYGSKPRIIGSSATIRNPKELGRRLTERDFSLITDDGGPRGRKTYVFWNPPRIRKGNWLSRRSANVEAHEIMAKLVAIGVPTIAFSKSKMTAEKIYRYVREKLLKTTPRMAEKVTAYRGGYRPEERREIEQKLFQGELLGVSATPALELGIDVGGLEACIIVGYPGKLNSFWQQAGRAGRKERDSIVFLIGLDTPANQYIMTFPKYITDKSIEESVIDPENPFVAAGHLRCAAYEIPLSEEESQSFGPHSDLILQVLEENHKIKKINDRWYYNVSETPHYEVTLRNYAGENIVIHEIDTGRILGDINRYNAQAILHPGAVYMHRGETYLAIDLDYDKNLARVKKEAVDYYTQPRGGTDIHHVDHRLREKTFGTGKAYWGEVTAYFDTFGYERIHFYSLDAISQHKVNLPTQVLETMALWIVPPENLMEEVKNTGLDPFSGLRGIGYAVRMLLPLYITCDTLDFSHTVGSVNSPWNAIFIYERYPHGLGFTEKAFHNLHRIIPAVLNNIRSCLCDEGCPCCVGKPLRGFRTWDVQRGEGSIPNKQASLMILERLFGEGDTSDPAGEETVFLSDAGSNERLRQDLKRRLERMSEPVLFHPIRSESEIGTNYPEIRQEKYLETPDVSRRASERRSFDKALHKRIEKKIHDRDTSSEKKAGDPLASRARKLYKKRKQ